jgi:hypothetical protein
MFSTHTCMLNMGVVDLEMHEEDFEWFENIMWKRLLNEINELVVFLNLQFGYSWLYDIFFYIGLKTWNSRQCAD